MGLEVRQSGRFTPATPTSREDSNAIDLTLCSSLLLDEAFRGAGRRGSASTLSGLICRKHRCVSRYPIAVTAVDRVALK
jgi:hypothetical protein